MMETFLISKSKFSLVFVSILMMSVAFGQTKIEGIHYQTKKPVSVEIKDGKIVCIEPLDKLTDEKHAYYIAPGLFDNQVNGYAGVSFTFSGKNFTVEGIKKVTQELWNRGVTSYLATVVTSSQEKLLKNFSILNKAKNDTSLLGSLAGFHLEGPYISSIEGFRGSHLPEYIRNPNWNEFMAIYKASGRNITTVTIAPELNGAIDFIRRCTEKGITVALGHLDASKEIIDEAVLNGAKTCTHLGNGCANMINRHQNPLWPQLANDQLMISIICDGFHLRDEEIATFYKVKGTEKTIITSDVTCFAGLPPGKYKDDDGETIELTKEGMLRYPVQKVLYGSATPITRGIVKIMNVTGCTLGDAIRMASTNPASLYGFTDRGKIVPGKRADLILFTIGEKELNIKRTYVNGILVFDAIKQ